MGGIIEVHRRDDRHTLFLETDGEVLKQGEIFAIHSPEAEPTRELYDEVSVTINMENENKEGQ